MGISCAVSIPTYHRSWHACIRLAFSCRFFNAAGRICLDLTWLDTEYIPVKSNKPLCLLGQGGIFCVCWPPLLYDGTLHELSVVFLPERAFSSTVFCFFVFALFTFQARPHPRVCIMAADPLFLQIVTLEFCVGGGATVYCARCMTSGKCCFCLAVLCQCRC